MPPLLGRVSLCRRALCLCLAATISQSHLLGEDGAGRGVGWSDHRIGFRQIPLGAIFVRRQIIRRTQVPLQRFELPTILQADQILVGDRFPDRHCGRLRSGDHFSRAGANARESAKYPFNQRRQFARSNTVISHISRRDVSRECNKRSCLDTWLRQFSLRPQRLFPSRRLSTAKAKFAIQNLGPTYRQKEPCGFLYPRKQTLAEHALRGGERGSLGNRPAAETSEHSYRPCRDAR